MIGELARCNKWMFRKVRCTGYLKKAKDGKFITIDSAGNAEYVDTSIEEDGDVWHKPVPEDDYDGSKNFLKTYYEKAEREFVGIVVGMKMITLTAYLTVNIATAWNGQENTICEKVPADEMKCAVVFYGCNRSRLVPMQCLEVVEDFD